MKYKNNFVMGIIILGVTFIPALATAGSKPMGGLNFKTTASVVVTHNKPMKFKTVTSKVTSYHLSSKKNQS